jgi:hypothetical protein
MEVTRVEQDTTQPLAMMTGATQRQQILMV